VAVSGVEPDKAIAALECVAQENYILHAKQGKPICPNCKSQESVEETDEASHEWCELHMGSQCLICGAQWMDTYELKGYYDVTFKEGG
jgi:hypothetical protein